MAPAHVGDIHASNCLPWEGSSPTWTQLGISRQVIFFLEKQRFVEIQNVYRETSVSTHFCFKMLFGGGKKKKGKLSPKDPT